MTEQKIDKQIDIRGLHCPHTFVRAKLAIESMETGETLEILLDHKPATRSIPNAMGELGHRVVTLEELDGPQWRIVITKGSRN